MSNTVYYVICILLAGGVLAGISMMSRVATAARGNRLSAVCTAIAIIVTLYKNALLSDIGLWVAMAVGLVIGLIAAAKVKMIEMPQAVALLNGFGGAASALVAMVSLLEKQIDGVFALFTAGLALVIGVITLLGSLIAAGKLHRLINQRPVVWPAHSAITAVSLIASLLIVALGGVGILSPALIVALGFLASALFGIAFAIRVGGADMPITISLLNSLSGVAGAIAGMAISDPLLVAIGGIVGASGLILTQIMCRAMNRKLADILFGKAPKPSKAPAPVPAAEPVKAEPAAEAVQVDTAKATPAAEAVHSDTAKATPVSDEAEAAKPGADLASIMKQAKKLIIVPGYGMALAQAQNLVKQLADRFEDNGCEVKYAIHPVAGRMPGHMNVLLAEADVDYEQLYEMERINPEFDGCDLVIVIGANDVVNPAANTAEGTPIYGMPVLEIDKAKHIVFCNYDLKPGYAGVDNPLYKKESGITLMLGDAKDTLKQLIEMLSSAPSKAAAPAETKAEAAETAKPGADLASIMHQAKKLIIVPGYGMALAQAQNLVKQLADKFETNGCEVKYGIHPVAGRMPGHMNVLLAEADVDYEQLYEMERINPEFDGCDLVIVIGANDVVNPAANTAEGTPIYGMPVLEIDKAKHIVFCNYDLKPGYAGVDNPLYKKESGVTLMLGDAKDTLKQLIEMLSSAPSKAAAPAETPAPDKTEAAEEAESAKPVTDLASIMDQAKKLIIVPGYGMALAQAQGLVKQLADKFEAKGCEVKYGIHPVAGRMPGHMNVLLAEADVDYEQLYEMERINPEFDGCDLVIVIGANDVVNPAANTAEGTPIYGMPVLEIDKAKHIIFCNYDLKPGYAGVDNPLYKKESGVTLMLGDAKDTLKKLIDMI